jgi:hypothetical protein
MPSLSEHNDGDWLSPRRRTEPSSPIDVTIDQVDHATFPSSVTIRGSVSREILNIQQSTPLNPMLVSKPYRGDRNVILEAVKKRSDSLKLAQNYLKKDKAFIKMVVQTNGLALQYASKECQCDKEIVLLATTEYKKAFKFASLQLRNDKCFVKEIVRANAWALEYVEPEFQDCKEIVMVAIDSIPRSLYYASERLKDDKEVVLYAISREGMCLLYISPRLHNNIDYISIAVRNNPFVIDKLSMECRNNKKIMKIAIEQNYRLIFASYLSPTIQCDPEILLAALQSEIFARKMRGLIFRGVLGVERLIPKDLYVSAEFQKVLTKKRVDVFNDRVMMLCDVIIVCQS